MLKVPAKTTSRQILASSLVDTFPLGYCKDEGDRVYLWLSAKEAGNITKAGWEVRVLTKVDDPDGGIRNALGEKTRR